MVERGDFLDGDLAATRAVDRTADDTICTLSNDVEHLVLRPCTMPQPVVHQINIRVIEAYRV
jgi:hypothetical protein